YVNAQTMIPQATARTSHVHSLVKPVSSVISAAPKKPNDAYSAPGTTGPASAYTHATSQPKNEPRPRLTHVYMPPADVIRLLNWLIEYAVNRHAMSANRTASG